MDVSGPVHDDRRLDLAVAGGGTPALGLGSQTRNTVCLLTDGRALLSEELADLDNAPDCRRFVETVMRRLERFPAHGAVACDLHPTHSATRLAGRLGRPIIAVQHHFAHAMSCAADAGIEPPFVGIVCDGTGWGTDARIWGGEVLICEAARFRRFAHLRYFPLPGGDAATRAPWRTALAVAQEALHGSADMERRAWFGEVAPAEYRLVAEQLRAGIHVHQTSSLGRLFDAASFLAGACPTRPSPGQAPVLLDRLAGDAPDAAPFPFAIERGTDAWQLDWRPTIAGLVEARAQGVSGCELSARFHASLADVFAMAGAEAAQRRGTDRVVLSGGCFFNVRFRRGVVRRLSERGIRVATHSRVSTGDAGLSLGQAAVASCSTA